MHVHGDRGPTAIVTPGARRFTRPVFRASNLLTPALLAALACAACVGEAQARKSTPRAQSGVSMETAVRDAARRHPAITEATGRMLEMREQIDVAKAGYLPKVQAGVASGVTAARTQNWRPTLNLSGSQMIYDFGRVSSEVEAAAAGTRARAAEVMVTTDNVARDTALAFIEAQRYQALLAVARDQVKGVKAISALVGQRSTGGASSMSDQEQAEARVLGSEATQFEIEGERARWLGNVSYLSGSAVSSVSGRAPAWLGRACVGGDPDWARIPSAVAANERRKVAIAELESSNARLFPTLSLEGGADYDPFFQRDANNYYAQNAQNRRLNYYGGLRVSGDLYEGGANQARRRAANHALTAAMAADAVVRLEVGRDLAQARARVGAIGAQRKAVGLRDVAMVKTRDLYQQQYVDLGTRTLLDLLNAEQELYTVRFQGVNLAHDARRLQVECLYNTGGTRDAFALSAQGSP